MLESWKVSLSVMVSFLVFGSLIDCVCLLHLRFFFSMGWGTGLTTVIAKKPHHTARTSIQADVQTAAQSK